MPLPRSLHRLLVLVAAAAALTGAACTQQSTAAPATATRTVENIDGSTVGDPRAPAARRDAVRAPLASNFEQ